MVSERMVTIAKNSFAGSGLVGLGVKGLQQIVELGPDSRRLMFMGGMFVTGLACAKYASGSDIGLSRIDGPKSMGERLAAWQLSMPGYVAGYFTPYLAVSLYEAAGRLI